MDTSTGSGGSLWLVYSLMTVAFWGNYGILLHKGQIEMADPVTGRYKAFLFVGIAYFLTAVLAPLAILIAKGATLKFPGAGVGFSLFAGTVGAAGAFGILLAFGAKGTPPVVMSLVFAGAPIVNAVVSILLHPPAGGIGVIRPQFFLGILLAATGGCLVTLYKPPPGHPPRAAATAGTATATAGTAAAEGAHESGPVSTPAARDPAVSDDEP